MSSPSATSADVPRRAPRLADRAKRTLVGARLAEGPGFTYALMRARSLPHLARRGHIVRARAVRSYLGSTDTPKLQIGSGPSALRGWLNTDLVAGDVYMDLSRRLPFADETFAFAFGEHIIEHVGRATGLALLGELHRVLRPGGVLRLVTPDLTKLVALYQGENPLVSLHDYADRLGAVAHQRPQNACEVLNDLFRLFGHRHIYDREDLETKLRQVGFGTVTPADFGDSAHAELRGVERHEPAWENPAVSMCLEATRARS